MNGRLSIEEVVNISRHGKKVALSKNEIKKITEASDIVKELVENHEPVYGVTTGVGEFCHKLIPKEYTKEFQRNIIRSHSAGYGKPFTPEETRAIMAIRLQVFKQGKSGIKADTVKLLVDMINKGVHPFIYEKGSLGASGDLAPLSHLGLGMMGDGYSEYKGKIMKSNQALRSARLKPAIFDYKEGFSVINGTSAMAGLATLAVHDMRKLFVTSLYTQALTLMVLNASSKPFKKSGHMLRPHDGQVRIAAVMDRLLSGSVMIREHKGISKRLREKYGNAINESEEYVQDAYSLRVIPQFCGPFLDTLKFVQKIVDTEINSVTDNPIIISRGDIFHGGHFHGQYLSNACDYATLITTQLSILVERQINRLINKHLNQGLPEFLVIDKAKSGMRCGFEGGQYVATSLVAENRLLCMPASIQSIPANEDYQDVVSMGLHAARKLKSAIINTEAVIATELLAANTALNIRLGLESDPLPKRDAYKYLGKDVADFYLEMKGGIYKDEYVFNEVLNATIKTLRKWKPPENILKMLDL
jgi:histidine ammonia-lyase